MQEQGSKNGSVDINSLVSTLEPEQSSGGGLQVPGKERLEFRAPGRKSLLGISSFSFMYL